MAVAGSPLSGRMRTGVVHENPPHRLGGDTKEVRAILPSYGALIDQLEESLMDERGRLKGMVGPFAAQVARCQPSQFGVDLRNQLIQRVLAPIGPLL